MLKILPAGDLSVMWQYTNVNEVESQAIYILYMLYRVVNVSIISEKHQ